MELISPSLKVKVQRHVFFGVLKNNPVLAKMNDLTANNSMNSTTFIVSKSGNSPSKMEEDNIASVSNSIRLKVKNPFLSCLRKGNVLKEEDDSSKDEFLQIVVQRLETVLCIPED